MRPLDGVIVLDLTRLLPGAAATMLLANFGAEVIKIEEPNGGDYARRMPPLIDGEGAVFRATNRGKKSIVLDLKTPDGKATLERLAAQVDAAIAAGIFGAPSFIAPDGELFWGNDRLEQAIAWAAAAAAR